MKGVHEFFKAYWFLLLVSALLFCLIHLSVVALTRRPICGAVAVLAAAALYAVGLALAQSPRI